MTLSRSDPTSAASGRIRSAVEERPPIRALTSLRFFAAFAVLLFHSGSSAATATGHIPTVILNLLDNGYLGVSFFFILSGFILTYVYQSFTDARSLAKFYSARFARVYPIYLLCLALIFPVLPAQSVSWREAPQFALLQSWSPPHFLAFENWNAQAWTLSVELSFYILFPFLSRVFTRLSPGGLAALTCVAAGSILLGRLSYISGKETLYWSALEYVPLPLLRLPEFVYGVGLALIFLRRDRSRSPPWASQSSLALAVAVMASSNSPWVAPVASICFGLVIYSFADNPRPRGLSAALSSRPLVLLGSASYSLYLLELPIREWMRALFTGPWELFGRLTYPPVLIILSIVVFKTFEEPARTLLKRIGRTATAFAARMPDATPVAGQGE